MTYTEWCDERKCDHGHCPDGCEHPQPFIKDGKCLCGRCFFRFSEKVEMVPCDERLCDE